jgi:hypothetical protein
LKNHLERGTEGDREPAWEPRRAGVRERGRDRGMKGRRGKTSLSD